MKKQVLYGIIAVIITISTGFLWQNTTVFRSVPCSKFIDQRIAFTDFETIHSGSESTWIDNQFLFTNIQFTNQFDTQIWTWESLDKRYRLYKNQQSVKLRQLWLYSTVTLADMLRCLGEPQAYSAVAEVGPDGKLYTLSFFYEHEGYVVTAQYLYKDQLLSVTQNLPLFYIEIVPPNSSTEMLKNVLLLHDQRTQKLWIGSLKFWPGDVENVDQNPTFIYPEGAG